MRLAHMLVGCLLAAPLAACYSAPDPGAGNSYVQPNGNPNVNAAHNANDTNSLAQVPLGGTVSGLMSNATLVLASGSAQTTVTVDGGFSFADTIAAGTAYNVYIVTQPTAQECQVVNGQGTASSNGVNVIVTCKLMLRFSVGQAARTVIGQTDFTSYARNFNQTTAAANSVSNPWGLSYTSASGTVYLPDSLNSRILGYNGLPSNNGQAADFQVGQPDFMGTGFGGGATSFYYVSGISSDHRGGLLLVDMTNHRVLMYAQEFTGGAAASGVLGQPSLNSNTAGCSATQFNHPLGATTDGNVLAISDSQNNRVVIYGTLPAANSTGAAATLVLGQPDFTTNNAPATSAHSLISPQGVWTDGSTLAVVSVGENRVLFWHNLSTLVSNAVSGVAADVVLGQADLTHNLAGGGAAGLSAPQYIISDGSQFFVTDTGNNRVLIYSTASPANGQSANSVLGQPDFATLVVGGGTTGMHGPDGIGISGRSLIVADGTNDRFLVFDSN